MNFIGHYPVLRTLVITTAHAFPAGCLAPDLFSAPWELIIWALIEHGGNLIPWEPHSCLMSFRLAFLGNLLLLTYEAKTTTLLNDHSSG